MTPGNLLTLFPHVVVAVTIVLTMLTIAFYRNHRLTAGLTLSGLVSGIAVIVVSFGRGADQAGPLVVMDAYARFYIGLMLAAGVVITSLSYGYMRERSILREEYYVALLVAVAVVVAVRGDPEHRARRGVDEEDLAALVGVAAEKAA